MIYTENDFTFTFEDGEVEITKDDELIETRYIGFDTCKSDFIDWCQYYVENKQSE